MHNLWKIVNNKKIKCWLWMQVILCNGINYPSPSCYNGMKIKQIWLNIRGIFKDPLMD